MSELDYRIEHFDHNFSSVRGKRIFLYGAGKNTEAVIRHFDDIYDFNAIIVPETDAAEGSGKTAFGANLSARWKKRWRRILILS